MSYELSDIGDTSVEEPDWTSIAQESGLHLDNFQSQEGYVSFDVTNGNIQAVTMVIVSTPKSQYEPAKVEDSISEGSTVYVTAQDGKASLTTSALESGEIGSEQMYISMAYDGKIAYEKGWSKSLSQKVAC